MYVPLADDSGSDLAATTGGTLGDVAPTAAAAASPAAAAQDAPSNVNVSVRIFSPGDDGPVTQTNMAAPLAVVADPAHGTSAPSGGASPLPVAVGSTGGLPSTWIWNWQWSGAGCGSPQSPSSSSVTGSTWTWNWTWGCGPAPESVAGVAVPTPAIPTIDTPGVVGQVFGDAAGPLGPPAPVARATPSGAAPSALTADGVAPEPLGLRVSLGGAQPRVLSAFAPPRRSSARRGALPHARATASARPARFPGDRGPGGSGLVAGATATAGGGAPSSTATAIGMAAVLALFVFFAPQILLPLRAASARRVRFPSARLERPG